MVRLAGRVRRAAKLGWLSRLYCRWWKLHRQPDPAALYSTLAGERACCWMPAGLSSPDVEDCMKPRLPRDRSTRIELAVVSAALAWLALVVWRGVGVVPTWFYYGYIAASVA